jgi:hypothetical protein
MTARQDEEANRRFRQKELVQGRLQTEIQQFEDRAGGKRHVREMTRAEHDRAMEEAIIRAQFQKSLSIQKRNEDERLAAELERIKHNKFRDEKMRQQIRYEFFIEFFDRILFLVKRAMNYVI